MELGNIPQEEMEAVMEDIKVGARAVCLLPWKRSIREKEDILAVHKLFGDLDKLCALSRPRPVKIREMGEAEEKKFKRLMHSRERIRGIFKKKKKHTL